MTATALPSRANPALAGLRCLVSLLLFIHGSYRISDPANVAGFAGFLGESGVPAAAVVAWGLTIFECTGTLLLAAGRWQRWIALGFVAEQCTAIAMLHAHNGWFVVGAGRNGAEYSVLIIGVMLAVAWAEPRFTTPHPAK